MAEIAGGAVRLLLGVIRDEMNRLGRVRSDVQFIKEEMESMNSFLLHLARTTPPGGEHDEQVRTWMKQVRELAHACSNSIDRYLQHGNPAVYRARSSLGYLWWISWYLQKLHAQHLAVSELRELKARARDVGERRLRYGVVVPSAKGKQEAGEMETTPPTAGITGTCHVAAAGLGDTEDGDSRNEVYNSARWTLAFAEQHVREDCTQNLLSWLGATERRAGHLCKYTPKNKFPAIAIVAPDEEDGAEVVRDVLAHPSVLDKFKLKLWINLPPYYWFCKTSGPLEILKEIVKKFIPREVLDPLLRSDNDMKKELDGKIEKIRARIEEHLQAGTERSRASPLDILLGVLQELLKQNPDKLSDKKMEETAHKIKFYMEGQKQSWVGLDHPTYISILQQLHPEPKERKVVGKSSDKYQVAKTVTEGPTNKQQEGKSSYQLGEDQIEEKIKQTTEKIIAKMLRQLLHESDDVADQLDEDQRVEEIKEKIEGVLKDVREQLLIEETIKKINAHLEGKMILIILEGATNCLERWKKINCALSKLGCAAGSAVIVITEVSEEAEDYCNPSWISPIKYSLVGFYHEKAQSLTNPFVREDLKNILGEILTKCEPHEFCMKMFVCALYAHPNRSKEELQKLSDVLSYPGSEEAKANKMIKFFYNELHRDYKTCLLYLAIFPQDYEISRSRLVARWVVEGLIATEDWTKSVRQAKQCFYELANRWLVCPREIGATGKVKSCTLHKLVHNFITKMAKEEHIRETRLSHHLARHFSTHSDIRLRPSESMGDFLSKPSRASSQLQLLKVLDLEGCKCLKKNQKDFKNVCTMIILLQFLSLRNTDVTKLPKEINKLQQLEVLDIRQTFVGINGIKHLMLMKLKHLLAGRIDQSPSSTDANACWPKQLFSTVRMPTKTRRMPGLEVLSHVQAPRHCDRALREIGHLWQLRKLGVVIHHWRAQLENLLLGINDLHECIQSLSIEIKPAPSIGVTTLDTPPVNAMSQYLSNPPKFLKSLSINGSTMHAQLLPLLPKGNKALTKVTLQNTSLGPKDMKILSDLDELCSLRLRHINVSNVSSLTFETSMFQTLRSLVVEGGNITSISFENGTTPNLEKIFWSFGFTKIESLSGIIHLDNLQEVEFNGLIIPDQVKQAVEEYPYPNVKHNKPQNQGQATGSASAVP